MYGLRENFIPITEQQLMGVRSEKEYLLTMIVPTTHCAALERTN